MKKMFLIFALVLLIIPILISAQTSGWRDKGNYKEQILLKDSLISVCFSEDGTKFYTLHYNKIVYYWDFKTGVLIDSLILPKNLQVVKFSKDGHTIIGCDNLYPSGYNILFKSNLYIFDLDSKNLITKSNFKLPGSLDYFNTPEGATYSLFNFDIMNYHSLDSTLDLSFSFLCDIMINSGTASYFQKIYCGGSGIFKVCKDSIIKILQLGYTPTLDLIKINSSYYISKYTKEENSGGTSSLHSTSIKITYDFSKIIEKGYKEIILNEYEASSYYEYGKDPSSFSNGIDIPFSYFYYDNINKMFYVRSQFKYYYVKEIDENICDSITFEKHFGWDVISNDFRHFIYSYYDTIFFQNVISKKIDDTLISPFYSSLLRLSLDGRSLLAANEHGNIALFDKTILDVNENNKSKVDLTIFPNPASVFIYLPETDELIQETAIYSLFGEKVMQLNNVQSNIVDISGLSKGVYFLRINNKSYKFVKI